MGPRRRWVKAIARTGPLLVCALAARPASVALLPKRAAPLPSQAANPATLRFCNLNQRGLVLHHVTHGRWHAEFHFVNSAVEKEYENYVGAGKSTSAQVSVAPDRRACCRNGGSLKPSSGTETSPLKSAYHQPRLRSLALCCRTVQRGAGCARRGAQDVPLPGEAAAWQGAGQSASQLQLICA